MQNVTEELKEENRLLRERLYILQENSELKTANILATIISWSEERIRGFSSDQKSCRQPESIEKFWSTHSHGVIDQCHSDKWSLNSVVGSSSSRGEVSVPGTSRNTPSDETERYKENGNKQSKGNSEDSWATSRVESAATPDISLFSQSTSRLENAVQQDTDRTPKVSTEHPSVDNNRGRYNSIQEGIKSTDNYTVGTPVTLHWKDLHSSIFSDSDEDKEYGPPSDYVKTANTVNYSPEQNLTKQTSQGEGHSSSNTSEGYMSDLRIYSTLTSEKKPDEQLVANNESDVDVQTAKNTDRDNMQQAGNELSNASGSGCTHSVMASTSASISSDGKYFKQMSFSQQPPSTNETIPHPVATSTPMRSEKIPDRHVMYRPVDSVLGYNPELSANKVLEMRLVRPTKRLIGEIAFQLDRRILDYVFTTRNTINEKKRKRRFYGYTLSNIVEKIRIESMDSSTKKFNAKRELEMRYRYQYIIRTLIPFGYCIEKHADFSQEMVNQYGLLSGPPDTTTVKNFGLDDPAVLRMLLSKLCKSEQELVNVLILLDCLCLLAHDDGKPLFMW